MELIADYTQLENKKLEIREKNKSGMRHRVIKGWKTE